MKRLLCWLLGHRWTLHDMESRHTFNVDYPEYISTLPLEKP